VPATKVTAGGIADPGLLLVRSHYQQYDGAGTFLGAAADNCGALTEAGGDMGGQILHFVGTAGTTCPTTPTQQVQGNQGLQVRP
jgi:hypothetical protein